MSFSFKPTIYRAYFAVLAVLVIMLVARSYRHIDWTSSLVLRAGGADALIVALLALFYGLVENVAPPYSWLARVNRSIHWIFVFLLLVLAAAAQTLFLKTGEILNIDILFFFVSHARDLLSVAEASADPEMGTLPLICLGMLMLANLQFQRRTMRGLQYLVLCLPFGLAFSGSYIHADLHAKEIIDLPSHLEERLLYKGAYKNFKEHQFAWRSDHVSDWHRGILSSMADSSSIGITEFESLVRKKQTVEKIYQAPLVKPSKVDRPNILFILLESVRHDVVGAYRTSATDASNTPFLDSLAARGWLVERAYTTIPHTSKALVGIYCGTFPRLETDISEARPGNLPLTCLPHLLHELGYKSAHFQTALGAFEDRVPFLENVGFDHRITQESIKSGDWVSLGYLGLDDRAMIAPAIKWMKEQAAQGVPFFSSFLTIASHHPYASPGNIESVHDPAKAKASYIKAVRYTDRVIEELFTEMRSAGLLKNTLVVITGDHGEAFSEHGQIGHNGAGYEEGIRVPLIIYGSMISKAKYIKGLRQHIDILPTVLDMAHIDFSGKLPGKSLLSSTGHDAVIASCFYRDYCLSYVTADQKKLLYFYGKRSPEMYDLRSDASERLSFYGEAAYEDFLQRLGQAGQMKEAYAAIYRDGDGRNAGGDRK